MARKEYTQGDVIGIIGRVIGKGIEVIGFSIFLGAKILARLSTSFLWMVGKQVDMTNTLKEIKEEKSDKVYKISKDDPEVLPSPEFELDSQARQVKNEMNLIRQALDYSEKAYSSKLLPIREVLRIDKQASIMAKATRNFLKNNSNTALNDLESKMAEALVNACSFYEQYHATDNTRYQKKGQEYLLQTGYNRD